MITNAQELLDVVRCALADLEGLSEGLDDDHPAWITIEECKAAIANAEPKKVPSIHDFDPPF
jgi:hypothetical protein